MRYPGGKNHSYQKIINLMPPHSTYIETHLGSGAVLRNKQAAKKNIGVDLNFEVLYEVAQAVIPQHRVFYQVIPAGLPLEKPVRAAIVGPGDGYVITGRNVDVDEPAETGGASWEYQFLCMDAVRFLKRYPFTGNEFVYADPPYVMGARRSGRKIYRFEYDDEDHVRLLEVLAGLPCCVAISGYWSDLYGDLLAGWETYTFEVQTRGGTKATEWVWMNYESPVVLHDYQYLGDDYRERERIKRKTDRWVRKFNELDEVEASAILNALLRTKLSSKIAKNIDATRFDSSPQMKVTPAPSSDRPVRAFTAGSEGAPASV